jgi:hypothetical protein
VNHGRQWDRHDRVPIGIRRAIGGVATPNLLVASWRWRWEIALLAGMVAALAAGINSFGVLPTIAMLTVITVILMGLPPIRQLVLNRAWCIITAHRVRVGCAEAMIYSSRGKIPVILWTAHQPFGERVLLWCRAGTSIDDFVTSRAILTAACWAQDIMVPCDMRRPHLATLNVIRRLSYSIPSESESNHATGTHRTGGRGLARASDFTVTNPDGTEVTARGMDGTDGWDRRAAVSGRGGQG